MTGEDKRNKISLVLDIVLMSFTIIILFIKLYITGLNTKEKFNNNDKQPHFNKLL